MDKLSPEVRAAEKDVDTAYKSNPLTNRKLTEAIWYLLAVFEIELKWFLDPAEPRELMEKTKEIKKGISQLLTLKQAIEQHDPKILDSLEIGPDYSIGLAVVSANWIGYSDAQDIGVAVIREHHLVRKLVTTTNLSEILDWLSRRKYLPEEGVHYQMETSHARVGGWNLKWYGLRPLIAGDEFVPL